MNFERALQPLVDQVANTFGTMLESALEKQLALHMNRSSSKLLASTPAVVQSAMRERSAKSAPLKAAKVIRRRKRPWPNCPQPGCKNKFAPKFHGWCRDHRKTAGARKAAKARTGARQAA